MKTLTVVLAAFIIMLSFTAESCDTQPSSDQKLGNQQEQLMKEANAQVGMPAITHFQERKLLKMILELRDQENLLCYCYLQSEMTGKLHFVGKCVGYGIPYATEYTNPMKAFTMAGPTAVTTPQADPNGLFMPSSAEGTWVMLLDPEGKPHPVYFEPKVVVSPFPLPNVLD